jgi:hypothetical protein
MFTKTIFALAFALATASGALAATKQQSFQPGHDVYDAHGTHVGVLPIASVFRGQGYVYAPGKGIVDEACNLPTSACPNEFRNVN